MMEKYPNLEKKQVAEEVYNLQQKISKYSSKGENVRM